MNEQTAARGVGWLSLGLGVAILAAPRPWSRFFGLDGRLGLMRVLGFRDCVLGVGLLRGRNLPAWLRLRGLADAGDTALLVGGLVSGAFPRGRAARGILVALPFSVFSFVLSRRVG
ncbi:MAG: hypothetical protein M3Q65_14530 [Chloroflexota bacterium]|nr:hypothetical protein [Chloroflexota bacterium]